MQEEEIKQHLMSSSPEFRRLVEEHHQFEGKLQELQTHHFHSEKDLIEEATLKKKKLHLKDEMNSLIRNFRKEMSHQHS
jgi:uncharacterized protein YdcH (DUF465 family)